MFHAFAPLVSGGERSLVPREDDYRCSHLRLGQQAIEQALVVLYWGFARTHFPSEFVQSYILHPSCQLDGDRY